MSDSINRNPHPDFEKVQASRPRPSGTAFRYTQTALPSWTFGSGANTTISSSSSSSSNNDNNDNNDKTTAKKHISINPHDPSRPPSLNYKLLISAITPRPIALLSTVSPSPECLPNLAPFSYFNVMSHDPPIFVIGFATPLCRPKDSLRNLVHTREAVINIISEPFIEAANATSVDSPPDVSEWEVSGLTPLWDCEEVQPPRVKEAVFSVEVKVESMREWESRTVPGRKTGVMVVLEGVRFWAREDGLNEERSMIDPAVLQPIGRLGGITYSRTNEAFELPRPKFEEDIGGQAGLDAIRGQKQSGRE
ncbi:hypothetical protein E4U43_004780 [Claviceps pusilla]|uniref:Flavin reductase like domain-containing protein n=1 Tax=Claviceps pusilla TaxID=123648 RepID=A0A9P7N5P5_9HYPO|nr:hypothetical protein E4U43_004780 [Claviceps pusilla]